MRVTTQWKRFRMRRFASVRPVTCLTRTWIRRAGRSARWKASAGTSGPTSRSNSRSSSTRPVAIRWSPTSRTLSPVGTSSTEPWQSREMTQPVRRGRSSSASERPAASGTRTSNARVTSGVRPLVARSLATEGVAASSSSLTVSSWSRTPSMRGTSWISSTTPSRPKGYVIAKATASAGGLGATSEAAAKVGALVSAPREQAGGARCVEVEPAGDDDRRRDRDHVDHDADEDEAQAASVARGEQVRRRIEADAVDEEREAEEAEADRADRDVRAAARREAEQPEQERHHQRGRAGPGADLADLEPTERPAQRDDEHEPGEGQRVECLDGRRDEPHEASRASERCAAGARERRVGRASLGPQPTSFALWMIRVTRPSVERLLGVHPEVAIAVALHLLDVLPGLARDHVVDAGPELEDLLRGDPDVRGLATGAAVRLVEQEARVRQRVAAVLLRRASRIGTPMLATQPAPIVITGDSMKRMRSWMAKPESTWPPGVVMTTRIGSWETPFRMRSCDITRSAFFSSISPATRIVRVSSMRWTSPSSRWAGFSSPF